MNLQTAIDSMKNYVGDFLLEFQCHQEENENPAYDFTVTKTDGSQIIVRCEESAPTDKGDTRIFVSESPLN